MKKMVIFCFVFCLLIGNIFAKGLYQSHHQKGSWIVHSKIYWDDQLSRDSYSEGLKNWHDEYINWYLGNIESLGAINTSHTVYLTQIVLRDGFCYMIVADTGEYFGGCLGNVQVYTFDNITKEGDIFAERRWEKEFSDYGVNYFNEILQAYEKKCNEYLVYCK